MNLENSFLLLSLLEKLIQKEEGNKIYLNLGVFSQNIAPM